MPASVNAQGKDVMVSIGRHAATTGERGAISGLKLLLLLVLAIEVALVVMHVAAHASGQTVLVRLFDLDREKNIPTWFASMQLFLVAVVVFMILVRNTGVPAALRWPLPLFGLVFVFLSMDEFIGLHEGVTVLTGDIAWVPTFNDHGAWILPYCAIALVLLLAVRRSVLWVWRHDRHAFLAAVLGMALFFVGAVGIEFTHYYVEPKSWLSASMVVFEEWLEMVGVSLVLYATLHLGRTIDNDNGYGREAHHHPD